MHINPRTNRVTATGFFLAHESLQDLFVDFVFYKEHISPLWSTLLAHWIDEETEARGLRGQEFPKNTQGVSVHTVFPLAKTSGISRQKEANKADTQDRLQNKDPLTSHRPS